MTDVPPASAEIVAVYELPARVAVTGDCVGKSAPVRIAGLDGEVVLPTVGWSEDHRPYVIAPKLSGLPNAVFQRLFTADTVVDKPWFWGSIGSWGSDSRELHEVWVGAVALRFDVGTPTINYVESLDSLGGMAGGVVKDLFYKIDPWFESLGVWVRALTDQYVDAAVEASSSSKPGEGLQLLAVNGDIISRVAHASWVHLTVASWKERPALDMRHWLHVLGLVNSGSVPPVAYGLIASARGRAPAATTAQGNNRCRHGRRTCVD